MIDSTINRIFLDIKENFFDDFWENYKYCEGIIEEIAENEDDVYKQYLASDYASFKTATDYCVELIKASLKELLCD